MEHKTKSAASEGSEQAKTLREILSVALFL